MCESDSQLSSFFNRPTSAAEKFAKLGMRKSTLFTVGILLN